MGIKCTFQNSQVGVSSFSKFARICSESWLWFWFTFSSFCMLWFLYIARFPSQQFPLLLVCWLIPEEWEFRTTAWITGITLYLEWTVHCSLIIPHHKRFITMSLCLSLALQQRLTDPSLVRYSLSLSPPTLLCVLLPISLLYVLLETVWWQNNLCIWNYTEY